MRFNMKDSQKFIAFCFLGSGLIGIVLLAYFRPMQSNDTASISIIQTVVGALTLAFGGAANALFRTNDKVTVDNPPSDPVPTTDPQNQPEQEELPDYAR